MGAIARRRFLLGSLAVVAVACAKKPQLSGAPPISLPPGSKLVYKLDPNWGVGTSCDGCHGCRACQTHAANKLWASQASVQRAHVGCKCRIIPATLEQETYASLFDDAPQNPNGLGVDKRWGWVAQVLT